MNLLRHFQLAFAASTGIEGDLRFLVSDIARIGKYQSVTIGVVDGDHLAFTYSGTDQLAANDDPVLATDLCERVAGSGTGELVPSPTIDLSVQHMHQDSGVELCVPILVSGNVWVVVNVIAPPETQMGTADFVAISTLAMLLGSAIAIEREKFAGNYRLEQLAHLQRIVGRIAGRFSADLETIGDDVFEEITRDFGYSSIALGVIRTESFDVYCAYAPFLDGLPPANVATMTGISGKVARTGLPLFARDVADDPDYYQFRPETTQEICIPVRANGGVIGVLNVEASRE